MAIKGLTMAERERVVLPSDTGHPEHPEYLKAVKEGRETDAPTVFIISPLSKGCRVELGDMGPSPVMRDGEVRMDLRGTKRNFAVVERALRGWENYNDENGQPIAFGELGTIQTAAGLVPGASGAAMQRLHIDTINELASIILSKNGVTKEIVGNSAQLSQPSGGNPSETGLATVAPTTSDESGAASKKR